MWPGMATCACDRARHATVRHLLSLPASPPSRCSSSASLSHFHGRLPPLAFPLTPVSTIVVTPYPLFSALSVTAADGRRHRRRCPPFLFPRTHRASLPLHLLRLCRAPPVTAPPPLRLRRRQPRLSHRRLSPALSLSLLLDPLSASLHCVFHHRSPPRSPPLSTVGRLPLLPLRCTSISATTIVTIFRPRRPPASLLRRHRCRCSQPPPSPLFRALPFPPPPSPPSVLPLRSPRPSVTVDATTAASAPPSSSSHRLRSCLPTAVSLLPLPTVRVQAALPLLLPTSVAVSSRCRHRHEPSSPPSSPPTPASSTVKPSPVFSWFGWVRKEIGHGFLG